VIVADGLSTDNTREEIAAFQNEHPDLKLCLIDNPQRAIPSALNKAIAAATGIYILRLDAHSVPYPDYVKRCVRALEQGYGDNVGGTWEIRPSTRSWLARAIAAAAANPLAVGDSFYRYSQDAQHVDTVPFGAFKRSLVEQIGGFDESLVTNEDYEFNVRIRLAGGKIWLDPAIRSIYYARSTIGDLAHQYWRYGYWKARMLKRYPHTLRWRQAIPPLFVLSLIILGVISPWLVYARIIIGVLVAIYISVLIGVALIEGIKRRDVSIVIGLPLATATMHLAWGTANLWGYVTSFLTTPRT
jgi:glycosyltransferase involved in cell wall biosynthesis